MTRKPNLNGSTDLLAKAMRKVFQEAIAGAIEPLHEDMLGIREDMATKKDVAGLKKDIETTNKNMQAQFAEQETKISELISTR